MPTSTLGYNDCEQFELSSLFHANTFSLSSPEEEEEDSEPGHGTPPAPTPDVRIN